MTTIENKINNLYKSQNYFDRYMSSFIITIIFILIFFVLVSYLYIKIRIAPIKQNWTAERCSPSVIPFAGLINAPDGKGTLEYTEENFNYCVNTILTDIAGYALTPINYATSISNEMFMELSTSTNALRNIMSHVRTSFNDITVNIYSRILNILIPLQVFIIKLKTLYAKMHGVMATGLFTSLASYMMLKASIGAIIELVIEILIALGISIAIAWIIPFTWPIAAGLTAGFAAIAIPLSVLAVLMEDIFKANTGSVPSAPHCFAGDTLIELANNKKIKIKNLSPGTILKHNNKITSVIKLDKGNEVMYKLMGTVVSGSHKVLAALPNTDAIKGKWMYVKDHPLSIRIAHNDDHLYCLNTSHKYIYINNIIYADWDEMNPEEYKELSDVMCIAINKGNLFTTFENGFSDSFKLKLADGSIKQMDDIRVNDMLEENIIVKAVVKIDTARKVLFVYNYHNDEYCTPGCLILNDKTITKIRYTPLLNINNYTIKDYMYHIVTDKGYFIRDGNRFYDYNSNIDYYLEKFKSNYKI